MTKAKTLWPLYGSNFSVHCNMPTEWEVVGRIQWGSVERLKWAPDLGHRTVSSLLYKFRGVEPI